MNGILFHCTWIEDFARLRYIPNIYENPVSTHITKHHKNLLRLFKNMDIIADYDFTGVLLANCLGRPDGTRKVGIYYFQALIDLILFSLHIRRLERLTTGKHGLNY